jgi:hypothetical protein
MGTNLRLLHDSLGWTTTPTVTSALAAYPASALFDGSRHTLWWATSSATQYITWDAGVGLTASCDYLVISRADLLVAAGSTVTVQYSTDMAAWSDAAAGVALTTGALIPPRSEDWLLEFTSAAKRGWRVAITGSSTAPRCAGIWLGARLEVTTNPGYAGTYGALRTHRGADLSLSWGSIVIEDAAAAQLMAYLAAVSPSWPGEAVVTSQMGAVYGGRAHYLYDPTGELFRLGSTGSVPAALNVVCTTPEVTPERRSRRLWSGLTVAYREVR